MSEPVATAPVVPTPGRNRLGIAALILVLIAIALPIVAFIVTSILAAASSGGGVDAGGWSVLGGFVFGIVTIAFVSPAAIVGVVLGIIALTRPGLRKLQAIIAIVLGAAPALAVFAIPTAIDTLF